MSKEFKLPELGENIDSADILNVLVSVGEKIELEQSVIEIETDKATIEVPATVSGVVKELSVKPGDNVKVGQTILIVEETGAQEPGSVKKEIKKSKPVETKIETENIVEKEKPGKPIKVKEEIIDYKLPELGENIDTADILSVLVKKGDNVVVDQSLLEIETDKATIEVPSTVNGTIEKVLIKEGDKSNVGDVIFRIKTSDAVKKPEQTDNKKIEEEPVKKEEPKIDPSKGEIEKSRVGEFDDHQPPITRGSAPAAPSVRKLARELGVEIKKVPGTGSAGRISLDDVKAYVKSLNENRPAGVITGIPQEKLPDFTKYGKVENVPMSKIRKVTATHLSYAWSTIPHVTQFDKADITVLEKARKAFNPKVEESGGKLTVTSILIKVLTAALKKFPTFNCSIDMEKQEIIYKKYYNIGIAVDTENGLMVPVIKNTDTKNLTELSVEMGQLAKKARERKISIEELQGGCVTITNLGGIGGTSFTPIVNSPEVVILGVSRGKHEPVYKDGMFNPRLMLPLSLSYDHRIIDGADAARFLRWVCEALEDPMKILIESN
ncbi:MAG TPA: biotin/lipoyl-binding protein [Ignavibacteria bacterium]|nr:biotin/lipoyl-binding protein [Ignavibacteria bacterium]